MRPIGKITLAATAGLSLVAGLLVVRAVPSATVDRPVTVGAASSSGDATVHSLAESHFASPDDREFYESAFAFAGADRPMEGRTVVAGIVPHHLLAADLIADLFAGLAGRDYELVVLIGPNHFLSGRGEVITSDRDWETPYGTLEVDREAIAGLRDAGLATVEPTAMLGEHSMSGEVAFIRRTFPEARLVPLILRPSFTASGADDLAQALHEIAGQRRTLVIASVDFSHYQTSDVAVRQDAASIAVLESRDFPDIYGMAVDSPPTVYATMKFAELGGAVFELRRNSNSALLSGKTDLTSTTSYVTGWFAAP